MNKPNPENPETSESSVNKLLSRREELINMISLHDQAGGDEAAEYREERDAIDARLDEFGITY
jgi:hypothetical protein